MDVQILRIGQFVILCVPGEFTTMSGRRLMTAVRDELEKAYGKLHIIVAGLTNTYSSYITTYEEYQVQRYEGASTIYGPHTLQAYIQVRVTIAVCGLTAAYFSRVVGALICMCYRLDCYILSSMFCKVVGFPP